MTQETVQDNTYKSTAKDILSAVRNSVAFGWRNERKLFILLLLINTASVLVIYLQLASFAGIVDEVVRIKNLQLNITPTLIRQSVFLCVSFLVPSILDNLRFKYDTEFRIRLMTHLNLTLVDKFAALDIATVDGQDFQKKLAFADEWGVGSILNVATAVLMNFRDVIGLATAALILLTIHPALVVLAIIGALPIYIVQNKYGVEVFKIYNEQTDDTRIIADRRSYFKVSKKLIEVLLFNIGALFRKEIKEMRGKQDAKVVKATNKKVIVTFFADLLTVACLLFAIYLIVHDALAGSLAIGSLLLAFSSYRAFASTTNSFFTNFSRVQDQSRYAKRWFDLFAIRPLIASKPGALTPHWDQPPRIEFKDVSFTYPEAESETLKHVSFTIAPGEKLAMVGQNGAGKTTIVKLLSRVYDPTDGVILIDGIDLKDIDLAHWRSYLGVLFQDFNNYQMTAAEAIAIARSDIPIDEEKVVWAATMAGADEFIQSFPKKYKQILWKGFRDGVELSKGQFQRIAVARIFYRDAAVSILDEPTASIDAVVEEQIFEALEKKMEGKTIVLISHRFSTVKNADKILVVEHGEIKEQGSHKELMKLSGRYAELYTMQAKRYLEVEK